MLRGYNGKAVFRAVIDSPQNAVVLQDPVFSVFYEIPVINSVSHVF